MKKLVHFARKLSLACMLTLLPIPGLAADNWNRWVDVTGSGKLENYGDMIGFLGSPGFVYGSTLYRSNGLKIDLPKPEKSGNWTIFDVDNDGLPELVFCQWDGIYPVYYKVKNDGTLIPDMLSTMTWNDYNNIRGELKLSSGGEGVPGWDDMFGRDGSDSNSFGGKWNYNVDINSDGIPDLANPKSLHCIDNGGCTEWFDLMLNTGGCLWVENSIEGYANIRDFNGDGIADFVSITRSGISVVINHADGTSNIQNLYEADCRRLPLWTFDFDRDNDVDILMIQNNFLLFFENAGNGTFTMHDTYIEGDGLDFLGCFDVDSDGIVELIARLYKNSTTEIRLYDIPGKNIKDEYKIALTENKSLGNVTVIDQNHSGILSLMTDNSIGYPLTTVKNQRPNAPVKPTVAYNSDNQTIKIYWNPATDKESSSSDLTYELKVESTPGANDIVPACALANGNRRSLAPGANGYSRFRIVDVSSWPAGRYYVSVQAVDPNQLGSAFSESAIFEKKTPASAFRIECSSPKNLSVGDTVTLSAIPQQGVNFDWRIDGAEIIESSSDNTTLKVRFRNGGNKSISLSAKSGSEVSTVRHLEIRPASLHSTDKTRIGWAGDINADGKDEYLNTYSGKKFFAQDDNGNFSDVKKLYNTNLTFSWSNMFAADVEGTGLFDLICLGSSTYRRLVNNADLSFTIGKEQAFETISSQALFVDLDNDGHIEAIDPEKGILEFNDDYTSYTSTKFKVSGIEKELVSTSETTTYSFGPHKAMDINGDGLVDLVVNIYSHVLWVSNTYRQFICYNNGDSTFTLGEEIPVGKDGTLPVYIGDIDFDGKLDFVYESSSYAYGVSFYDKDVEIKFGNGREVTVLCPDGKPFSGFIGAFDIDNNGMLDLSFSNSTIIYLMPDYSAKMVTSDIGVSAETAVVHVANGDIIADNVTIRNISNERPSKPEGLRYTSSDDATVINWNGASDKETPSKGLRYNISIKRKDSSDKGLYVISPLNLGKDFVNAPSDHYMSTATCLKIPVGSIPEGNYEMRVQAVDANGMHGAYSDPLSLNISEAVKITVPSVGYLGQNIEVKVRSNSSTKPEFGSDATVRNTGSGTYEVTWNSLGKKDIMIGGTAYASILIKETPSSEFNLPEKTYAGAKLKIQCDNADQGEWLIAFDNNSPTNLYKNENVQNPLISQKGVSFTLVPGDYETFSLTYVFLEESNRFEKTKQSRIVTENSLPAISCISAKEGGWNIAWDKSTIPSEATAIKIYRETSRLGNFEEIASVETSAVESGYTDNQSNPTAEAKRYAVSFEFPNGESRLSVPHRPIQLKLNKCNEGAINLMWSKYQGCDVASYSIYGGESPESLAVIGSVNGNKSSFIDPSPKAYYAVSVNLPITESSVESTKRVNTVLSNVVPVSEASDAILAQELSLALIGGGDVLDLASAEEFGLRAVISPSGATYSKIDWNIEEGADGASIDENGHIYVKSPEKIIVSGTTRDGSNLTATATFDAHRIERPITWLEYTTYPSNVEIEVGEVFVPSRLKVEPENPTEAPYFKSTNPEIATVDQNGRVTALRPGIVMIVISSRLNPKLFIDYQVTVKPDEASKQHPITEFKMLQYPAKYSLQVGESFQLKESHNADAVEQPCWTPGDHTIVSVDSKGLVTAKAPGTVYVECLSLVNPNVALGYVIRVSEEPVDRILIDTIEIAEIEEMMVKDEFRISVYSHPNVNDCDILYSVSDESVVKLDGNKLTALKPGDVVISAFSSHDNNVRDSITLHVVEYAEKIPFESVVIDNSPSDHFLSYEEVAYLHLGDTFKFTAKTTGQNSNDRIVWSSSNQAVISINQDGYVITRGLGKSYIFAKSKYGTAKDNKYVFVLPEGEIPFSQLYLINAPGQHLRVGETFQCGYTFEPANATDQVIWRSQNPEVAEISDSGLITALSPGHTHIYITSALLNYGSRVESLWVDEPGGVDDILNDAETMNVYNLQGILIRAKATKDEIERLPAGVYIINGRKVTVGTRR